MLRVNKNTEWAKSWEIYLFVSLFSRRRNLFTGFHTFGPPLYTNGN
jgi:hypothetical protein